MASQKYAENSTENEQTSDTLIPWGEALSIPNDKSAKIYAKKIPLGYNLLTCNEPSKYPCLSRSNLKFHLLFLRLRLSEIIVYLKLCHLFFIAEENISSTMSVSTVK